MVFVFEFADDCGALVVDECGVESLFEVGDAFGVFFLEAVDGSEGDVVVLLNSCWRNALCERCDYVVFGFFV